MEFWTRKRFQIRACVISGRKAKHLDATTMFTYSHANTPLGQSERAYYLSYFIKWILNLKNPYWSSRVDSRSNLEIRHFRIPTWKAGFLLTFEVWCHMFSLLFVINTGTLNNSFPEFFSFFGCNLCKTLQLNNLILHAFSHKETYSKEHSNL